jgi:protein-tyrosine phosphatase
MDNIKILFVCLGNICRSPSAEAIFAKMVEAKGLGDKFIIDSAGTSGWHNGGKADARMQKHAIKRGYDLVTLSRRFYADSDFSFFDLIIGMDDENITNLRALATTDEEYDKIHKMTDYCKEYSNFNEVPDPYYDGDAGFELVLDILEDSCKCLLEKLDSE